MIFKELDGGLSVIDNLKVAGAKEGKYGVAVIVSENSDASAVFTSNKIVAAPVIYTKKVVEKGKVSAVFVNSGNANCFTGNQGIEDCESLVELVSKELNIPKGEIAISSTGVIGRKMPLDVITGVASKVFSSLGNKPEDSLAAANAIMTTDKIPKQCALEVTLTNGEKVKIAGITKGSGMIAPNMGTMLSFITSDAAIDQKLLQQFLSEIVEDTFNMISVDGDTSTNDTCLVLCNGLAENPVITEEDEDGKEFKAALAYVMEYLAKQIAGDGEGCTRLFEVTCNGAATKEDAKIISKSVVCSTLTKAAVFGKDANWGRILCAMGYSGVTFDPEKVDIVLESEEGSLAIVKDGIATDYSEEKATQILSANPVKAILDIHAGEEKATAWGCDLTYEYVTINADYRS